MTGLEAFLYATGAGFAVSILDYTSLVHVPKIERPVRFKDPAYLLKFFGHPIIGGFLGFVLNKALDGFGPGMAIVAGAAAPGIWRALVRSGAAVFKIFGEEMTPANDS